jgi:Rrf2 family cysteine metabolism transcriptional repressor
MKLSTRGRYGIRAILDLAGHRDEEPVLVKDISKRQEISVWYLQHLINPLIAGGLVRSTRGPGGGISLTKSPSEIKLSDVIQLLEGSLAPVECVDDPAVCPRSKLCVTRDTWVEIKKSIDAILESTTIQDLLERQKKKQLSEEAIYQI